MDCQTFLVLTSTSGSTSASASRSLLPLRRAAGREIYEPGFEARLIDRQCTRDAFGSHIGYVPLDRLGLYDRFGAGVLERIPLGYR